MKLDDTHLNTFSQKMCLKNEHFPVNAAFESIQIEGKINNKNKLNIYNVHG